MAAYLITHSLLSSWLHLIRENPYEDLTTEGDPLAEFMLVLKREPTPRTEAILSMPLERQLFCPAGINCRSVGGSVRSSIRALTLIWEDDILFC